MLSPNAVSRRLPGVPRATVIAWAASGLLPGSYRKPNGRWMIAWDSVMEYIRLSTPAPARHVLGAKRGSSDVSGKPERLLAVGGEPLVRSGVEDGGAIDEWPVEGLPEPAVSDSPPDEDWDFWGAELVGGEP